jgi:hypothetical protein
MMPANLPNLLPVGAVFLPGRTVEGPTSMYE